MIDTSSQAHGRRFAAQQISSGNMDAAGLLLAGEECIPQALERDEIDRAEFWAGIQHACRCYLLAHVDAGTRQSKAPYEILTVKCAGEDEAMWFCEREDTETVARDIIERAGYRFTWLVVRPAFFEEIGLLCLS